MAGDAAWTTGPFSIFRLRRPLHAARTSAVCFQFDLVHDWVQSFLTDRTQQFAYSLSSVQSVLFGVPQGSVLGPLLYVLYTAELALVVDLSLIHISEPTNRQKSRMPSSA